MSNDKKTLADVQPGGRVRLGDQPTIENRARELLAAELHKDFGPASAQYVLDGNDDGCTAMRAIIAALSAQPSPGGQGDASHYWPEVDRILVDAYVAGSEGDEFDMIAARNAIHTALAARQPVGWQPMESAPKDGTVVLGLLEGSDIPQSIRFRDGWEIAWDGYRIPTHDGPLRWAPLYAATPAQKPAQVYLDGLDRALGEAIDQRDRYHEVADDLAGHIAAITGVDIGEHSSANCPWENAIEAAEEYKPAQAVDLGPSQSVLAEVAQERARQEAKWGQQNHVDWTPTSAATDLAGAWPAGAGDHFKFITDYKAKGAEGHRLGYFDILMEEVAEAHDEARDGNAKATRAELVQVAAVAVAWIECIDRRLALTGSQAVGK
ncbi:MULTISPECIES: hypothetical protein [Stenotrophomonas]|uniref:Uncharacterized protein n=1 Tax=Stenotrophomonas pavanii TaxID=487698 RepID=A0ABM7QYM4_9GAMM|nr:MULTISPECIES: hypothetical protein [Stenotrophomonas]BCX42740.1 hypothetical protein STNY_R09060 [Stenotrophomonas pavanii]